VLPFRRKGAILTGATVPAACQMRSKTENPCPRRAVAEIRGVAFCGPCAREQEAYFAIGELVAREGARGHRAGRWPRRWRGCGGSARVARRVSPRRRCIAGPRGRTKPSLSRLGTASLEKSFLP